MSKNKKKGKVNTDKADKKSAHKTVSDKEEKRVVESNTKKASDKDKSSVQETKEPKKPEHTEQIVTKIESKDDPEEETQAYEGKEAEPEDKTKDDSPDTVDERGIGKAKIKGHIIITKGSDPRAKWYVVHTTSGHEARVAETLRQRVETMGLEKNVYEILVPTQDRVVIRGGKKATIKEKIFPGYMLVKIILDDPTWLAIRTTPGITGFVGAGNQPTSLSEIEVVNIQKFVSTPAKRFKTKFTKGEAVKITDGPFSDFLGTIQEIDEEKGKVNVLVSIFGRETPVELDLLQITKV